MVEGVLELRQAVTRLARDLEATRAEVRALKQREQRMAETEP